jgi:hypothetical protein
MARLPFDLWNELIFDELVAGRFDHKSVFNNITLTRRKKRLEHPGCRPDVVRIHILIVRAVRAHLSRDVLMVSSDVAGEPFTLLRSEEGVHLLLLLYGGKRILTTIRRQHVFFYIGQSRRLGREEILGPVSQ